VANGVVYVGSGDHNLYEFDAEGKVNCTGTPKTCAPHWTATTGGSLISSPAVANGVVYIGSYGDQLYAFGLERVPPTTSVVQPSNGVTLSGKALLDASASDNVSVSKVDFRITGGNVNNTLIGAAVPTRFGWVYNWNTTSVPKGSRRV
jgi:outer membrane protein assembly factor BamB